MQLTKGFKKVQPTFIAALKDKLHDKLIDLPEEIKDTLEEFKDIMPSELLKKLLSKREVDHHIDLESRTKPSAVVPYPMAGQISRVEETT